MDTKGELKSDLTQELESLREEIVQLQGLFLHPFHEASEVGRIPWPGQALARTDIAGIADSTDIVEDCPLGMALVNREFGITKANRMFCRILDYGKEETCSLQLRSLALEPDLFIPPVQQIFAGVYPAAKAEGEWLRKNGESFWVQFMAAEMSGEIRSQCCLIVIEDISARKAAEQNLQSEKKLLEWIISSSVDGIVAFDCDGFFTVWNPGMERIFGISARKTLGRPVFLACPFFKTLGEDVNFDAALKGETVLSKNKTYIPAGGGRTVCFESYYGPILSSLSSLSSFDARVTRDSDNRRVIGGLAIIRDVTDRRLAEKAKTAGEERYLELFENASDMMYTCNLDGEVTSINKMGEKMLGYSKEEATRMKLSQLVTPECLPTIHQMTDPHISDKTPVVRELEMRTKEGDKIIVEASSRLIFHEGKPRGIQGIVRDIGERKRLETALADANRKLEEDMRGLEQLTREMTLFGELGDILCACLAPSEIYDVIARISQELFPGLGGALFVFDSSRNIVESVVEWGGAACVESVFTPDGCWALRRGKVHWVEDTHIGLVCKHIKAPMPKGFMCVPMMAQGNTVGVLHLAGDDRILGSRRRLALSLAERVATALSRLRPQGILSSQSVRDPLTGLFNRDFMKAAAELELRRASRTQNPLSFIMLSVDRPHHLHEDFDLEVADSVVCKISTFLQSNIRKGDIACRFSDDTFVVAMPQTSQEVGLRRAKMFHALAQMPEIKDKAGKASNVSISVGAATYPEQGQTVDTLLQVAETAAGRTGQSGDDRTITGHL
ncbi:MAG: PAS domain S-box protein [Acidobacteriota bacterium]|nr:PAS domain S-box protein [Acidobacteriota bacterium]